MVESTRHWSRITESGTVVGMQMLLMLYRLFGRWGFRLGLFPVIGYYYLTRKQARLASQQFLQRLSSIYPEIPVHSSFRHFLMFGEILLDKLLVWTGLINITHVRFKSDGFFEQAIQQNQGGVIVVSHLGNTEVCSALAHQQPNLRLTLLVYTEHAKKFNTMMQKVGANTQIEMYQVTEMNPAFAMLMAERVNAGEFLVIAGDRTPVIGQQRLTSVEFLGRPANFPQGPFILANLLKCPVYLMFCLKNNAVYDIYIERFSTQLKANRLTRQSMLKETLQRYADRLAAYARLAPLQWFNFYSFWQNADESADKNNKEPE